MTRRIAEETVKEASKATTSPFMNQLVLFLYGGLLLYFLYQFYKGARARKAITGERFEFPRTTRRMNLILAMLVAGLGIVNFIMQDYLGGALMFALAVVFFALTKEKIIVCANGIYADSNFYEWKDVKRWGWDKKEGDLILISHERGKKDESHIIRIGREQMEPVNDRIRQFKLNKTKK
ncbi:MAG: DUF5673 domain-containing protein [Ndongobacter sp.]|nr:DUF5673 domain-containing protein [Ndongobacter sp.]